MSLPEEVASQLNSRVQRINVLQKLVLQEKVNLGAKALGTISKPEIDAINEEIREFLLGLLAEELGNGASETNPFEALGIDMTPEKAQALDSLLERMVSKAASIAPIPRGDESPVTQPLPPPSPRAVAPNGQRILSPVLAALKASVGGEDEWEKLPPEERNRRVKDLERQAAITYQPNTK